MIDVAIAVGCTCVLFIALAYIRPTGEQFYLGTGKYGPIVSAISIVAAFTGGGALINTSGLATKYGTWAIFDVLPSVAGLLIAAVLVGIGFFGRRFSASFFDIQSGVYDKRAVALHYAQIAFLYTLVIAAQIRAVATVAQQIGVEPWIAILVLCGTVAIYAYRGFDAVTRTDIAQVLLMLPMYLVLLEFTLDSRTSAALSSAPSAQTVMPLSLLLALALPLVFLPISQEIHQRGAAVQTDRAVGLSYLFAALMYAVLGSTLVYAFSTLPNLSFAGILTGGNRYAAMAVGVGIASAILSTLDTCTNIASHALQKLRPASRLSGPVSQVILLLAGALIFLYFKTVLSLILFALFVYMAGPALTFMAVFTGIHPRQAASVCAMFVALQGFFHFKGGKLIEAGFVAEALPVDDPIKMGLFLLFVQALIVVGLSVRRRMA